MSLLLLLRSAEGAPPADNWQWRVRTVDEHGAESAWSDWSGFHVSQAGSVPICSVIPWGPSTTTTPRSAWTVVDLDGDAQTDYQVQLASDPGFTTIVQDSGVVTSSSLYHQHTALAAGTYYRRVKVRTGGVDWSAWSSDTIIIQSPTAQSNVWDLYIEDPVTHALTAVDLATYPLSGVSVVRRLDGPLEFSFVVNNFDGAEAGIADDALLVLRLQDDDGNRLEFRGEVIAKKVGDLVEVTCADPSRKFARYRVTRQLESVSVADVVKAIVEDPTGNAPTGITAQCENVEDPYIGGQPIFFSSFDGAGRSLADWLDELGKATGCRWYLTNEDGSWTFHWFNPLNCPDWAKTVRDDIDYAAESSTQTRALDTANVSRDRQRYVNRVRYWGRAEPPALPAGVASYDDFLTESTTDWTAISPVTVSVDATTGVKGTNSLKFSYSYTAGASAYALPRRIWLGYRRLPQMADWTRWDGPGLGEIASYCKMAGTINGVAMEFYVPAIELCVFTTETALATRAWGTYGYYRVPLGQPYNVTADGYQLVDTSQSWQDYRWINPSHLAGKNFVGHGTSNQLDYSNVVAFGFALVHNAKLTYVPAGQTCNIDVWFDLMRPLGDPALANRDFGEYVETAAVTAGSEIPSEEEIALKGLPLSVARMLAEARLAQANKTLVTVSDLALPGIRNIPMEVNVPLVLTRRGISGSYPLVEVAWKPADSGWRTDLTLGDLPLDAPRTLESLARRVNTLDAERQT